MTIESAAMIVNAQSRKGQDQFDRACAALKGLPYTVDAHAVHDPKELDATITKALAQKPDLLILGGGDGTISGLVDHLVGTNTALAVLPLGTANSFARTLGIPLDLKGAVDHLLKIVAADREWNEQAARKQLLTVFEAAGATSEVARDGRRRLSSLLFA